MKNTKIVDEIRRKLSTISASKDEIIEALFIILKDYYK